MNARRIIRRVIARADIEDAIDYYLMEAGEPIARAFLGAVEKAIGWIILQPAAGSPRYSEITGISGLRGRALGRFPYVVLYSYDSERIEILRLIHQSRDLKGMMIEGDEEADGRD